VEFYGLESASGVVVRRFNLTSGRWKNRRWPVGRSGDISPLDLAARNRPAAIERR